MNEYLGEITIPSDLVAIFGTYSIREVSLHIGGGTFELTKEIVDLVGYPAYFSINPERSWEHPADAPAFAYWQCYLGDKKWITLPKDFVKIVASLDQRNNAKGAENV